MYYFLSVVLAWVWGVTYGVPCSLGGWLRIRMSCLELFVVHSKPSPSFSSGSRSQPSAGLSPDEWDEKWLSCLVSVLGWFGSCPKCILWMSSRLWLWPCIVSFDVFWASQVSSVCSKYVCRVVWWLYWILRGFHMLWSYWNRDWLIFSPFCSVLLTLTFARFDLFLASHLLAWYEWELRVGCEIRLVTWRKVVYTCLSAIATVQSARQTLCTSLTSLCLYRDTLGLESMRGFDRSLWSLIMEWSPDQWMKSGSYTQWDHGNLKLPLLHRIL